MKRLKILLGFLFFLVFVYLFALVRYKNTCFILVYHRIDNYQGGLKSLYVKPETFEKQMRLLKRKKYESISLTELRYRLENKLPLTKKFCITFDDGYKDLLNAYPILKKYGYKATVYIHVEAIKSGVYSYPKMPQTQMISENELRNVLDVFEVGSHSISHPDLSNLTYDEIVKEIKESKMYLEKTFNTKIEHFCYPFGRIFKDYSKLLSQFGYKTATTLNSNIIYPEDNIDFYSLPRVEWKEISASSLKDFIRNIDFYLKVVVFSI